MGGWPQLSSVGGKGYWGQNPENRAGWAQFLLMHGGGGNFCVRDVWLRWGKVWLQLSGTGGRGYWGKCNGCANVLAVAR